MCSLAVAAAALYHTYQLGASPADHRRQAAAEESADATRTGASSDLGKVTPAHHNESTDLASSSTTPKKMDWTTPTNGLSKDGGVTSIDSGSQSRPIGVAPDDAASPLSADDVSGAADVATSGDGGKDLLQTPIPLPRTQQPALALVQTAFRPTGMPESITAEVKNSGGAPARISQVKFAPDEIVPLGDSAFLPTWGESTEDKLVLYLTDDDNQAVTKGRHGDYVRQLETEFAVDPGAKAVLNLAIRNPKHQGYGLRGDLTLALENGENFRIENVTLAFVDAKE